MPRRRSRTRRKIKGGAAVASSRRTSRSRSRSRSRNRLRGRSRTGAKDSADAVAAVAEVVEKELKQDEDNINNIIEKIGKWVDDHPGDAAEILSDFEDRYKKLGCEGQRGEGKRGEGQRGGAARFDHDGVALQPELAIFLFAIGVVWRRLMNERDRTIFAVVVMVAIGAGFGIGVALRVGLTLALVVAPVVTLLDQVFPRQNPIQQQHPFNPGYLIHPELWDTEEG